MYSGKGVFVFEIRFFFGGDRLRRFGMGVGRRRLDWADGFT